MLLSDNDPEKHSFNNPKYSVANFWVLNTTVLLYNYDWTNLHSENNVKIL